MKMVFQRLHTIFKPSRTKSEVRTLHWCLLVPLFCAVSAQGAKTACRVPSVKETEITNLTCYFPEDVSQSKKDFTVYHYNGVGGANAVVDCLWVAGSLHCFTQPGYSFDSVVTNSMTVQIPRVTPKETGKYACQTTEAKPDDLGFCELHLRPDRTSCEQLSDEAAAEIRLTCNFPEDLSLSKKDFMVYGFDDQGIPNVVVDCFWYLGSLSCLTQPGFQPETRVFHQFNVRIRQTSARQNGTYMCEISGARTDDSSLCSLLVPTEDKNVHFDCNQGHLKAVVAVLAIMLITAVVVSIISFIACDRSPCKAARCQRRKNDSNKHRKRYLSCQFAIPINRQLMKPICGPDDYQHQPQARSSAITTTTTTTTATAHTITNIIACTW